MSKLLCSLLAFSLFAAAQHPPQGTPPEKALARLMQGNRRHVAHHELHPDMQVKRRHELAKAGQHPFAIILGCADSRVAPELLFDQGIGDLFVIRDAGNFIDDGVLGTIEYAVEHLGVRLVMVLGHENCGAITAAVNGVEAQGHIRAVVEALQPAVEESANQPGDKVHNCVLASARRTAKLIRESEPTLKLLATSGSLQVVAADYDMYSGKVTLLDATTSPTKTATITDT